MRTLLYIPLLRLLGWLWWLPALVLLVTWGLADQSSLNSVIRGMGLGALFLAGAVGAVGLHGTVAVGWKRFRRWRARQRFLCPDCLRFAAVRYACAGCRQPLPEVLSATRGLYVAECPHCDTPLFQNGRPTLEAYCSHCHGQGDRDNRHGHRVRVVATLVSEDYVRLCQRAGVAHARLEEAFTWMVTPETMIVIVNLPAFAIPDPLPEQHLLRHLDALWMSGMETDALALAQSADRLFRHLGEQAFAGKKLPLYVDQRECAPAVRNMLSARFAHIAFNPEARSDAEFTADMATVFETRPSDSDMESVAIVKAGLR